jgi:hypothetical protein
LKFYNELVQQGKLSRETFHTIRTTGKVPEIDFEEEDSGSKLKQPVLYQV